MEIVCKICEKEFTELRKMLINPLSRTRFYPGSQWNPEKGVGFHLEKMDL